MRASGAISAAAIALLGAGCGAAPPPVTAPIAAAPAAAAPPAPVAAASGGRALTFAWPVPSRAWVTETAIDKKGSVVLRFEMIVGRDAASRKIAVSFAHFSLVSVTGLDLKDPASQPQAKQIEALSSAMLPLLVSEDGRSAEAVGFDELVTRLPALVTDKPEEQRSLAEFLDQQKPLLLQKATESWGAWVGTWLQSGVHQGTPLVAVQRIPLYDGSSTDIPVTYAWVGADPTMAGAVDLRMDSVLEGETFRASMEQFLDAQIRANPPPRGTPAFSGVQSIRREQHVTVVTDPSTMRMRTASSEEITAVALKGGAGSESKREMKICRFDWE